MKHDPPRREALPGPATTTLVAALAVGLGVEVADASVIAYYDDNAQFVADIDAPLSFESFEQTVDDGSSFTFASGVTASVNNGSLTTDGSYPTDGVNTVAYSSSGPSTQFSFTFPFAVTGFAVDVADLQTFGTPSVYLSTTTAGQVAVVSFAPTARPTGNVLNFGLIDKDTSFVGVTFNFGVGTTGGGDGDFIAFDSLQFAAVPSPAAAMGGAGLLGLVGLRRRRTA